MLVECRLFRHRSNYLWKSSSVSLALGKTLSTGGFVLPDVSTVHPRGGPSACARSRLELDVDSKFLPYVQVDKKAFRHPLPQQVTAKMAAFWPGCILARLGAETDKPRSRVSLNAHCPALFDTLAERGDLT